MTEASPLDQPPLHPFRFYPQQLRQHPSELRQRCPYCDQCPLSRYCVQASDPQCHLPLMERRMISTAPSPHRGPRCGRSWPSSPPPVSQRRAICAPTRRPSVCPRSPRPPRGRRQPAPVDTCPPQRLRWPEQQPSRAAAAPSEPVSGPAVEGVFPSTQNKNTRSFNTHMSELAPPATGLLLRSVDTNDPAHLLLQLKVVCSVYRHDQLRRRVLTQPVANVSCRWRYDDRRCRGVWGR